MRASERFSRDGGKKPPGIPNLIGSVVADNVLPRISPPGSEPVNGAAGAIPSPQPPPREAVNIAPSASVPGAPKSRYVLQRPKQDTTQIGSGDSAVAESDRLATEAVGLMWEGKLEDASKKINAALRLRLDRSYYHLINGLIYHLQARVGQNPVYDLAEQGYQQAINFDNSNWQAHYFAGLLSIEISKFDTARQQLADALILHPDDAGLLNAFAYAAYRSGVPDQAAGAINAMEAMGGLQTVEELQNAAVIMAAVGENEKAQRYLDRLKSIGDARRSSRVERRVSDWRDVYRRPEFLRKTQFLDKRAVPVPAPGAAAAPVPDPGRAPGAASGSGAPSTPDAGESGSPGADAEQSAPGYENKMVVVDVVLISTEESLSTTKGINLLRGLQIQFGSAGAGTFAYQKTVSNPSAGGSTTAITRNIGIPSITYSLNIFNSSNSRDEILARPTLVATAGSTSEFFSGEELNAVVVNASNNASASPVNILKEIGTHLMVKPTFLSDGRIALKVLAERTFIKTPSPHLIGFSATVETSKSKVEASVVMRPGETLIMSGLSEKESQKNRDGVPLLQDIPLIQYLFASSTSSEFQKSTLLLITPRPPQYVYQPEKARQEYEKSLTEDERPFASLRARYADWFRPYPNWASIFHHLQENSLWREFRTGDVVLENWSDMRTLKDRMKQVLEFLYF
jgi:general secretion pathway protein D